MRVNFENNGENTVQELTTVVNELGITQIELALKIVKVSLDIKNYMFDDKELL